MKKSKKLRNIAIILGVSLFSFLVAFVIISSARYKRKTEEFDRRYETQSAIERQIEEAKLPEGYYTLLDYDRDDCIFVLILDDGAASITIHTFQAWTIPYTAEVYIPIVQQALNDAGVPLSELNIITYNTNKFGTVSNTLASWKTRDYKTGTLADTTSGENDVQFGVTLKQVFEYYSAYEKIVLDMISEAGGEYKSPQQR